MGSYQCHDVGPLVFVLWGHTSVMMLVLWCLSCGAIPVSSCWSSGVCPVGPYQSCWSSGVCPVGPYQCHDVGPLVFVLWGNTSHVGPLVFVLWGNTRVMLVLWCLSCGVIPESCWSSGVCPVGSYQCHWSSGVCPVGPYQCHDVGPLVFVLWGHTRVMLVLWCLSCGAILVS